MNFLRKHRLVLLGAIIGALGGFLYYYFIGCASGTCAITSRPLNSSLYGALMGGLIFSSFQNNNSELKSN